MQKVPQKQYTIRNIPVRLDRILRKRAKDSGKSFNQVALEALMLGAGEKNRPERDFSEIIGSMTDDEAQLIEKEVQLQHKIDMGLWK